MIIMRIAQLSTGTLSTFNNSIAQSPTAVTSVFVSLPEGRLQVLPNNNLQILRVSKADEGVYRCEARVEARGEIDFRDIVVLVNGKSCSSLTNSLISEQLKKRTLSQTDQPTLYQLT